MPNITRFPSGTKANAPKRSCPFKMSSWRNSDGSGLTPATTCDTTRTSARSLALPFGPDGTTLIIT